VDIPDLVRMLRERYGAEPAPTCRVCGGEMEIGYSGQGRVEWYCKNTRGFTKPATDHYWASQVMRRSGDSDVIALCDLVEQNTVPVLTMFAMERIWRGFERITREEFSEVLQRTIGANENYIDGVWPRFLDNPLLYSVSRSPIRQGEELFKLALSKALSGEMDKHCWSRPKEAQG
jgi:hypothetical protein